MIVIIVQLLLLRWCISFFMCWPWQKTKQSLLNDNSDVDLDHDRPLVITNQWGSFVETPWINKGSGRWYTSDTVPYIYMHCICSFYVFYCHHIHSNKQPLWEGKENKENPRNNLCLIFSHLDKKRSLSQKSPELFSTMLAALPRPLKHEGSSIRPPLQWVTRRVNKDMNKEELLETGQIVIRNK